MLRCGRGSGGELAEPFAVRYACGSVVQPVVQPEREFCVVEGFEERGDDDSAVRGGNVAGALHPGEQVGFPVQAVECLVGEPYEFGARGEKVSGFVSNKLVDQLDHVRIAGTQKPDRITASLHHPIWHPARRKRRILQDIRITGRAPGKRISSDKRLESSHILVHQLQEFFP